MCALAVAVAPSCAPSLDGAGGAGTSHRTIPVIADAPRAPIRPGAYDLGKAPVFSKALMFVDVDYVDKNRLRWLDLFLGSLEYVQRDTPEVIVEHWYQDREPWVSVRVNATTRRFPVPPFTGPWQFDTLIKEVLGYVQDHLLPVAPEEEGPRLLEIELAATNGMLHALDPHSVLLDAETYRITLGGAGDGPSGAVGMVVEPRDDDQVEITGLSPSGPAALAGLAVGDRLVRIDDLAVRHMNLDDVIPHLRGGVGSTVQITFSRGGKERTVAITRDFIRAAASVSDHRVLTTRLSTGKETAIGYVRLEHFYVDAATGVVNALAEFAKAGVAGVVLDLRGNSGGLYEQAVKVADAFLKSGRIVAMVAPGNKRKVESAQESGSEPEVPLAVLVDHGSAAAAEIVASALKENDRAVVVGEKTFGEGSVQVLFDLRSPLSAAASEKLGLKLTTAEWVTPANGSIQAAGLTPDIVLRPARVSEGPEDPPLRLEAPIRRNEAGYDTALARMGAAPAGQPFATLPFVFVARSSPVRGAEVSGGGNRFADAAGRDFSVQFARDLLAAASSASRRRVLEQTTKLVEQIRGEEERRLASALRRRKIDWTAGSDRSATGQLELEVATSDAEPGPGQKFVVRGVAKNVGTHPLHRVRAVLKAPGDLFDGNEFTFGTIEPGRTRTAEITLEVPEGVPPASHTVTALGSCDECGEGTRREFVTQTGGRAPPVLSIDYATADAPNVPGPDSKVSTAQSRRKQLVVTVRVVGAGAAKNLLASLRSAPGQEYVRVDVGLFRTRQLDQGQAATFSFVYDDLLDGRDEPYRFDLLLWEEDTGNVAKHRISFERGGAGAATGHVTPPTVSASAPTAVHSASVRVTGEAVGAGGLRDVFVTVHRLGSSRPAHKVFYLASPGGGDRLPFIADVPLEAGSNYLRVIARGADGAATTYPLLVLMTPAPDSAK